MSKPANVWKRDWLYKNPVTGSSWNIEEVAVQKRFRHMLNNHKPKFLICEAPKKGVGVKDIEGISEFVETMCEVQRKAGRMFVLIQSLSASRPMCEVFRSLRNKAGVRQVAVHGAGSRLTTNAEAVTEALLDPRSGFVGFDDKIQKGIDVYEMKKKRMRRKNCLICLRQTISTTMSSKGSTLTMSQGTYWTHR